MDSDTHDDLPRPTVAILLGIDGFIFLMLVPMFICKFLFSRIMAVYAELAAPIPTFTMLLMRIANVYLRMPLLLTAMVVLGVAAYWFCPKPALRVPWAIFLGTISVLWSVFLLAGWWFAAFQI